MGVEARHDRCRPLARDQPGRDPKTGKSWTFYASQRRQVPATAHRSMRLRFASTSTVGTTSPARSRTRVPLYYWQTVFGGFHTYDAKSGALEGSLFRSCKVVERAATVDDQPHSSVRRRSSARCPCRRSSWRARRRCRSTVRTRAGSTPSGVFHPTGTYATHHPTGTGPFMLSSWTRGDKLVLVRNPNYWGKASRTLKHT